VLLNRHNFPTNLFKETKTDKLFHLQKAETEKRKASGVGVLRGSLLFNQAARVAMITIKAQA
jgi:hypothetical protein